MALAGVRGLLTNARRAPNLGTVPEPVQDPPAESRWLLLIHRIPPKPGYERVKMWRRLAGIGSVTIKSAVYVLPRNDQAIEDFKWIAQEIVKAGGDATICAAHFVDGLTDSEVIGLFNSARDEEYAAIAEEADRVASAAPDGRDSVDDDRPALESTLERLRRRLGINNKLDFFGAPKRSGAEAALLRLQSGLRGPSTTMTSLGTPAGRCESRTWVTRSGIHVDRIASAWLILRFIDRNATFRFVVEKGYVHQAVELRFDMFNGEFTHEGDRCTFEVLVARFGLDDPALRAIAEIVHDVDLKESKFGRPETAGFESLIAGIAHSHKRDEDRLARGAAMLDDFYEAMKRRA
jgi:hypothetical protein